MVDVAQSKLSANNVFTIAKRTVEGQVSSVCSHYCSSCYFKCYLKGTLPLLEK